MCLGHASVLLETIFLMSSFYHRPPKQTSRTGTCRFFGSGGRNRVRGLVARSECDEEARRAQSRSPNAMKLPGVRNAAAAEQKQKIGNLGSKVGVRTRNWQVSEHCDLSLLDLGVTERLAGVRISHVYHPTYATWRGSGGGRCWSAAHALTSLAF